MSTPTNEMREWAEEADLILQREGKKQFAGEQPDFFAYDQALKRAARYACIARAEAAERQAAALERIAAHLEGNYIVTATMDEAAGIAMMRERDRVNAAIRDGAAAGLEDDDRDPGEVAKAAEWLQSWGFDQQ